MNINSSFTAPVRMQVSVDFKAPEKQPSRSPITPVVSDVTLSNDQQQSRTGFLIDPDKQATQGRERINLRVLNNPSLSLNSQRAISAYASASGVGDNLINGSRLNIDV